MKIDEVVMFTGEIKAVEVNTLREEGITLVLPPELEIASISQLEGRTCIQLAPPELVTITLEQILRDADDMLGRLEVSTWLWVSVACNLGLLVGCFLILGWGESYRVANIKLQKRVRSLEEPDPLCGCGHHISFHDREDGCHYTVIHVREARMGPRSVLTTCTCVHYVGPEPLPRVIDLPIRREEE